MSWSVQKQEKMNICILVWFEIFFVWSVYLWNKKIRVQNFRQTAKKVENLIFLLSSTTDEIHLRDVTRGGLYPT